MTESMQLAYEERGDGPVLALVHGFPLDRTMWTAQLAGLAKVRRTVAIDLRGHGLSEDANPGDYSMDLFADDLAVTLDEIGAPVADVCGLSMGGYVVLAFWRRHRERVRSLILACTKADADTPEAKEAREKTAAAVREKGTDPLWETLGPKMFGSIASPEVKEKVRRMFATTPPEVAAADALAMAARPDSTPDLAGIDVPALWIAGAEDQIMPLDGARASAAKIPGCRFAEIPGAGHLAPMENPDAVNEAMREFLKAVGK